MSNIITNIPVEVKTIPFKNNEINQYNNNSHISFTSRGKKKVTDLGYDYASVKKMELRLPYSKTDFISIPIIEEPTSQDVSIEKHNVFNFVSNDLMKRRGESVPRPNTLSNISYALRNRQEEILTELDYELMNEVDKGFEKIEPLKDSLVFYRTVSGDNLDKEIMEAKENDIIIPDRGYAQVTPYKDMTDRYVSAKTSNPVLFEIHCPKGSRVCIVPDHITGSGRIEGMIPGAAQYKVLKKEKTIYSFDKMDFFSGEMMKMEIPITKFVLELI